MHSSARLSGVFAPLFVLLFVLALNTGCKTTVPNSLGTHNSSRWEKDIATFEAADATNRPPAGCIVFVGSSSIRRWQTLAQDFPGYPVVNRGFGGSQIADAVNFADRIIIPYKPRQVVLFAGGNDINAGKDPVLVFGDFVAFVKKLQQALPKTQIAVISLGGTPARWAQIEATKKYNALVEAYCQKHHVSFINVFPLMLGPDGTPRNDIFVKDRLHLNATGYEIWRKTVQPYLLKE